MMDSVAISLAVIYQFALTQRRSPDAAPIVIEM